MSDEEDDLFADSDSDDTADLIAQSTTGRLQKKKAAPKKPPPKDDDDSDKGLFDSDSEDEEPKKPAPKKKPLSKRERLEALAKRHARSTTTESTTPAAKEDQKKQEGYESGDSYDSADFQRTKEDDDFLDTTGEDAEAVHELYAEQHFDDERPDKMKKKNKKRRHDEAEEDTGEPDNPIMAAVHRMKKKKREKKSYTDIEEECKSFLGRMELAAEEDEQAIAEKRPATKKLAMLKEVQEMLARKDMQRMLLDLNLLIVCKRWIQPLPNGTLGNVTIRQRVLEAAANMTGENGISANDLKRSEFGKVVMILYKHRNETPAMKRQHKALIEQWSRPIFQKSGNMRDLERVHAGRGSSGITAFSRQQQQQAAARQQMSSASKGEQDLDSLIASGKKGGQESGINRVRVPFSKGFAFSVRPEAKTTGSVDKRMMKAAPAKDNRGKLSKRMLAKGRTTQKNQRSANVSIEGRPTKG